MYISRIQFSWMATLLFLLPNPGLQLLANNLGNNASESSVQNIVIITDTDLTGPELNGKKKLTDGLEERGLIV